MDSPARKIKVAQVITRMDWGGSPDVLRLLCTHLDSDRFEQRIFIGRTAHPSSRTMEFLRAWSSRITFIPELVRDIRPLADLIACWRLYRYLKAGGFDLVHTHTAKAGALGRIAARLAGVPVVIHTSHGHNFYGYFNRCLSALIAAIERFLAGLSDGLTVLTKLEQEDCLRYSICSRGKLFYIRTCFEPLSSGAGQDKESLRRSLGCPVSQAICVGFIGRLEPVKGADLFVRAALRLCKDRPELTFVLVGEGSMRAQLEAEAAEAGCSQRILFVGWKEKASELIAAFDLVALPSRNEAVGIALLEAQAAGIPVIAARVGGIPEVVLDGRTGLLIEPEDVQGLADAVKTLADDPERRRMIGQAGRAWVQEQFQPQRLADEAGRLYLALLEKKKIDA